MPAASGSASSCSTCRCGTSSRCRAAWTTASPSSSITCTSISSSPWTCAAGATSRRRRPVTAVRSSRNPATRTASRMVRSGRAFAEPACRMPSTPLSRRHFLSLDFGDRRGADDHWLRVHRVAMACRFEVMSDAIELEAARAALDEADEVEAMLTVFREASEVAALDRGAAAGQVTAAPALFALLLRSADLHAGTGGAFDITATPLSRCWGFLEREGRVPDDAEIARTLERVGMRHVVLDADRQTVAFAREGVEISFGAIGKGYALDRMGGVLRARGTERALLSAGRSSVLAIGGRGRGWPIDIRPRLASGIAGRLWIRDGAVGTSGAGEQFIVADGQRYGHVLDPRTGRPAGGVLAASVVTGGAAAADALSTAFRIGGAELACGYCDTHPGTMAIVVDGTGNHVFGRYDGAILEQTT